MSSLAAQIAGLFYVRPPVSEEITSIGIKLDTADIERGNASLDTLASKGDKVDAALKKIEGAGASAGKSLASLGQGSSAGLEGVAKSSGAAADGMGKLGQASASAKDAIASTAGVSGQAALAMMGIGSSAQSAAGSVDSIKRNLSGLDSARASINSMAQAFTLATVAVKAAEVAVQQVGAAISYAVDSAKLAARYETLGVVMQTVGRNAGYTGQQMMDASKGVQALGITMLESRDSVTKMASAQIDLANATKLARIAQDAAVIGGVNSSEALKSMVYGIQSAQTDVLRTIGINVSFEESYKKLANQIGTTTEALTEQEKTTARTNAVLESGAKIAGAYEDAMGTAGKQLTSMARYSEDAQVKLGAIFNETMLLAISTYTGHLKNSNAGLDELTKNKSLETWSQDMATTFAFLADSARNSFSVITGTLDTVYTAMLQVSRFTVGDYKGIVSAGQAYSGRMADRLNPENQMRVQLDNLRAKRDQDAKTLTMPNKSVIVFETPEQKQAYQDGLAGIKKYVDDRQKVIETAGEATAAALKKNRTAQQKIDDDILRYRKTQTDAGIDLASKEVKAAEAAIRSRGKTASSGSATAGQSEVASIRAKVIETQRYIDTMRDQGLEAARQTEGEKLVIKYQQELAGGLKGAARANKEKALTSAESLAALQKESSAIEKSLKLAQQQADESAKQVDAIYSSAESTRQQALAQEAANTVFGRGRTAIEEMTLATQKNRLARLESLGLTGTETEALKYEIEQQERKVKAFQGADYKTLNNHTDELLRNAKEQASLYQDELRLTGLTALERAKVVAQRQIEIKYAKELADLEKKSSPEFKKTKEYEEQVQKIAEARQIEGSAAVARVVQDDWARTADQINQSLTDALMRGFESGKSFAMNLRDTLVNMFKTLVLRPIISATLAPVGGTLSSIASAATGGGSGGGLMGTLSNLSSLSTLGSAIGTGIAGTVGSTIGSIFGMTAGNTALGMTAGLGAGSSLAAASAASVAGGGAAAGAGLTGAATALGAIPVAGWVALAGVALYSMFGGSKDPASESTGDTTAKYDASGKRISSHAGFGFESAGTSAAADALQASYSAQAKALGIGTVESSFGTGGNSDGKTRHFAVGSSAGGKGYHSADNLEYSDAAYSLEASRAVFAALQGSDLPKYLAGAFDGIAAGSATQEQITTAINGAQALKQFHDQLQLLPFDNLKDMSYGATKAMIEASGSLEALGANVAAYYEKFFSEGERAAQGTANITAQFEKLGVALPETHAAFRALVEAQDLNTTAGQNMAAALFALAPAFDSAASAAAAAAQRMSAVIADYATAGEVRSFQVEQIRQGLANGGVNLSNEQIANANRQDARALWEQFDAQARAGDTSARGRADAVLDQAAAFAKITENTYAKQAGGIGYIGSGGGGGGGSAGASAADSIKSAWQSITNSMWDEVKRIRGLMEGAGADGFAAAQARLAIATKQARANDQEAAKSLPQLNATMLTLAEANVGTLLELKRIQNSAAGSLSDTASMLSSRYGLSIPAFAAGGYHAGGARIVGEHGPELEVTGPARILNAGDTRTALMGGNDSRAADEIVLLRKQVAELSASNEKIRDLLVAVTRDGRAMQSEVAA